MKDAHAVPMHAIQVLLVVAWLLGRSRLPQRRQVWLVGLAVVGYAGLVGTVLLRTAAGLAPFALRSAAIVGYLLAAGLLAAALIAAAVAAVGGAGQRLLAKQ
jgi:hypothetical protein